MEAENWVSSTCGLVLCHYFLLPDWSWVASWEAGPFSSGSAEALAGVARVSLLGRPVTVLVGVLAVPLPLYFSLMSFTWLIFIVYLFPIRRVLWIFLSVSLHTLCGVVFHVVCVHSLHIPSSILLSFFHFENFIDDK
jgi:hypothetical protein